MVPSGQDLPGQPGDTTDHDRALIECTGSE